MEAFFAANSLIFDKHPKLLDCVKRAYEIIDTAVDRYGDGLILSWNGGKDATVLFHMVRFVYEFKRKDFTALRAINLVPGEPFPEEESFARSLPTKYHLQSYYEKPLQSSIRESLNQFITEEANVTAFFMGSRRTDPYCEKMADFANSDTEKGWADFMRVNPLLDWSYSQIWEFILAFGVDYCGLYDRGFTSIGSVATTKPNPLLLQENGTYLPAHSLKDSSAERAGRI